MVNNLMVFFSRRRHYLLSHLEGRGEISIIGRKHHNGDGSVEETDHCELRGEGEIHVGGNCVNTEFLCMDDDGIHPRRTYKS